MIVRRLRPSTPYPVLSTAQARRGLSLMEVLMSLAIFLMSLVALSQLIEIGSDRARDTQMLSQAAWIAQSNMAKLISGVLPLTGQGDMATEEDPDWNFAVDASAEGNIPGLFLATVIVSRIRNDGTRFESKITQYVLDPTKRGNTTGTDGASNDPDTTGTTDGTTGGGGGQP